LHIPELHVWSNELEVSPVPVHCPLPHVWVQDESSAQSSEHVPDPQTNEQIEPLSQVAAQLSLPEHVNSHVVPAAHKQL
jgi:hypothetical protein